MRSNHSFASQLVKALSPVISAAHGVGPLVDFEISNAVRYCDSHAIGFGVHLPGNAYGELAVTTQ